MSDDDEYSTEAESDLRIAERKRRRQQRVGSPPEDAAEETGRRGMTARLRGLTGRQLGSGRRRGTITRTVDVS